MPDPDEFAEFELRHIRVGGTALVPARLASLLIISGHAEMDEDHPARAEASDVGQPRFPKGK